MKNLFNKITKKIFNQLFEKNNEKFLKKISGVVHVGANIGQEREIYNQYGLSVIWIEPIPQVFEQLKSNIKEYKHQQAVQALITDIDNKEYEFHIANNNGASSSIFELKDHRNIWPSVDYQESILLKSTTLTSLFKKELLDISKYQALIMDTQGSELLVLKGSLPILKHFNYIKTEVADFESYEGCCTLYQMVDFMLEHGYTEYSRKIFAQNIKVGKYYDIVFKKTDNSV